MKKNVLVLLPIPRDFECLRKFEAEYNFHFLEDESFVYPQGSLEFDILAYVEKCKDIIKELSIDVLFYSHDPASLVAGALHDETGLPGPSAESMFLSIHKYYSRQSENSPIQSGYIDLDKDNWKEKITGYPVYFKPTLLTRSLFQFKIDSEEKAEKAIEILRKEVPPSNKSLQPFFSKYIDLEKYPLATRNIVVSEEVILAKQYCVDGWVDKDGKQHIWSVSDHYYHKADRPILDCYSMPSTLPQNVQDQLKSCAISAAQNHKINNSFYNVEIWLRDDGSVKITEVNGRFTSVWHRLHDKSLGASQYKAALELATDGYVKTTPQKKTESNKFGCQFHVVSFEEGYLNELIDLELANTLPHRVMYFQENKMVTQKNSNGTSLMEFDIFGDSFEEAYQKGNALRKRLLKRKDAGVG